MKCKWNKCDNEARKRSPFCSDSCKASHNRNNRKPEQSGTLKPEHGKPEPTHVDKTILAAFGVDIDPPYTVLDETTGNMPPQTVYKRQAVSYDGDDFETRPEPLDPTDQPLSRNRGRYTRQDGSQYQFDCQGSVFEVVNGRLKPEDTRPVEAA